MTETTSLTQTLISSDKTVHFTGARFPQAIQSVSREEFYGSNTLELTIRNGNNEPTQLPDDLQGHLFIIAPAGAVDSPPADPTIDANVVCPAIGGWIPVLSGDGMVYRLDFHKTPSNPDEPDVPCTFTEKRGHVWLANRLVKTPSYYVDVALHNDIALQRSEPDTYPKYPLLSARDQFHTIGFARLSIGFGTHNQNNTGFVPLRFKDQPERLVVTEDIGRPWEIDPCSLKMLGPVGLNADWQPVVQAKKFWSRSAFPPVMNSAHPVFDAYKNQFFTVNIVKSPSTLLNPTRWLTYKLHEWKPPFYRQLAKTVKNVQKFVDTTFKFFSNDALYLVYWDGQVTPVTTWLVTHLNGKPIRIEQTIHQIGLTEKYIVLADTSLKIGPDDLILDIPQGNRLENFWRKLTAYPQAQHTKLYVISRDDLQIDVPRPPNSGVPSVKAKAISLSEALVHFVTDYNNPDGKLILHAGHIHAWDTSEFVHGDDRLAITSSSHPVDPASQGKPVVGMVTTSTDVNHISSYVIDLNAKPNEQVKRSDLSYKQLPMNQYPWGIAFCAYRDNADHKILPAYTDLYWNSWGLWYELLTDFIYDMYRHYKHRERDINSVVARARIEGIPSQLCRVRVKRVQTSDEPLTLELATPEAERDRYQFPRGVFGTSAQFVPRHGTTDQAEGYVVCVVTQSNERFSYDPKHPDPQNWSRKSELWIFDASDLGKGPQYKLSHAKLNFGFTAHTTWLSDLQHPPAREYDIRADFADWMNQINPHHPAHEPGLGNKFDDPDERFRQIETLFNTEVFPHFE